MTTPQANDALRAAIRQHHETDHLLGVDVTPFCIDLTETAASSTSTEALAEAPAGAPVDKVQLLEQLHRLHDEQCTHCTQATDHTQTVFGDGNPDADLMFVGEAPGEQEDLSGKPFVGRAGKKLDEIIAAMGMRREDVYIANVLKARPLNNRTPLPHEVAACAVYLAGQVAIIRPRVMVSLGGPATKYLLKTDTGITRLRGQWGVYEDADAGVSVPLMPTFHPAYLLRNYTPDTRKQVWSDMQAVMKKLA